ncbi:MAG: restriction endonuclease subunit S [Saprospiraceae bacterium]|nr:restriction endonuclease subunit S [Saprospiraceae bacterium]
MKWEKVSLRDYTTKIGSGVTPKGGASVYQDSGVALFRSQNIYNGSFFDKGLAFINEVIAEKMKSVEVLEGDVLLNITGDSVARCCYAPVDFLPGRVNQHVAIVRADKEKLHSKFLMYQLISPFMQNTMLSYAEGAGATRNALTKGIIEDLKINLPPLPTQRKIASILSAYDDLIENNLKRIKLLEERAFASYKLIVKSEKLIEGKVGDLADVKSGYAFKSRDWSEEGFPVIKIKNIGNNDIELTDCSFIPESIAEVANKFKLNAGDLLIAMTGATVGKIGMMPKTETSFYLNQRVGIFKPKVENAELFLFCFFNEPTAKNAVESLASGAAQPNISGGQLESIKLYYPKIETVTEFGNSIKSHFELIWNLKEQNNKLREARDILLPKLMSGQIEV